jgi:SAM-dependent methyltransferase
MKALLGTAFTVLARMSKRFSRKNLYEWLAADLANLPRGRKVLCIGVGGRLDAMIKAVPGVEAVSIDIDEARGPGIVMDGTALNFEQGHFDAVCMMEVLEHVAEPRIALAEVHRVLADDRRFVMSTPFIFGIHEEPWDFWRFKRHEVEYLLSDFSEVSIRARNRYYSSIIVLFMRTIFSPGRGRQLVGGMMMVLGQPLFALLLLNRVIPDDRSTTGYFVICRKPVAERT